MWSAIAASVFSALGFASAVVDTEELVELKEEVEEPAPLELEFDKVV